MIDGHDRAAPGRGEAVVAQAGGVALVGYQRNVEVHAVHMVVIGVHAGVGGLGLQPAAPFGLQPVQLLRALQAGVPRQVAPGGHQPGQLPEVVELTALQQGGQRLHLPGVRRVQHVLYEDALPLALAQAEVKAGSQVILEDLHYLLRRRRAYGAAEIALQLRLDGVQRRMLREQSRAYRAAGRADHGPVYAQAEAQLLLAPAEKRDRGDVFAGAGERDADGGLIGRGAYRRREAGPEDHGHFPQLAHLHFGNMFRVQRQDGLYLERVEQHAQLVAAFNVAEVADNYRLALQPDSRLKAHRDPRAGV